MRSGYTPTGGSEPKRVDDSGDTINLAALDRYLATQVGSAQAWNFLSQVRRPRLRRC